jgi:hypothetical protein
MVPYVTARTDAAAEKVNGLYETEVLTAVGLGLLLDHVESAASE